MQSFDEEEEVFFDTRDYLSSEESTVEEKDLGCVDLGYDIWLSEPQSVEERRERFIRRMGLYEFAPSKDIAFSNEDTRKVCLDRTIDCNGTVSSSSESSSTDNIEKSREFEERAFDGEGNCMVDELENDRCDVSVCAEQFQHMQVDAKLDVNKDVYVGKKKANSLWKILKKKIRKSSGTNASKGLKPVGEAPKASRLKVLRNKKKCKEFSAVYVGQEFHAHQGLIWTMKFSPDGQYLASGGEDGVVRVWRITTACTSCKNLYVECNEHGTPKSKKSSPASIIFPETDFQLEELPLQEFYGHTSDVLDLAWSNSNCILSSSMDKTVRLWQVGQNECLGVFTHNNYVTCTQFNPVNENYFISGSIDGKVRIWGVNERRVVDWADDRDVITAICYHPNGKRFVVGSVSGSCRFYEASGNDLLLDAEIHIRGKRKSGNRITGIQFPQEDSQKVMITSEDSKIRIFDGLDIVHKFKGLSRSGRQMSASFTSTGRHIISVGEDSHIYVWNYNDLCVPSKHKKSVRSCEHFFYEGVSVAIPWSGRATTDTNSSLSCCTSPRRSSFRNEHQDSFSSQSGDSERFSLANWFFMDGSFRSNATWPEEKLPLWDESFDEQDHLHCDNLVDPVNLSPTWGLVIVTAGLDGMIRTFHNYGLPIRS